MKYFLSTTNLVCLMLASLLVLGLTRSATAAGTTAGTTITNAASVDYQVNSTSQDTITS